MSRRSRTRKSKRTNKNAKSPSQRKVNFWLIGIAVLIVGAIVGVLAIPKDVSNSGIVESDVSPTAGVVVPGTTAASSPAGSEGTTTRPIDAPVVLSPKDVQRITATDAKVLLDRSEAILYDVRVPGAFEAKHVIGALSFPEAEVQTLFDTLPAERILLLYCT